MEAAVSAYAVNSKWWLGGLGLGRGSRKQSLLSINGVGYTRKAMMMRNNMNCTRRFRMESSWMGSGAIERQRFKDKEGRFVMAEAVASGTESSAQGDVEKIAFVLPYVGVGAVMFGIGYHLRGYLLSTGITSTSTTVAARVLLVVANIIGTTIASSLLDKLGCKGGCKGLLPTTTSCFSRMINVTSSSSLLLNLKSSDDIDTYERVIDLKTAGVPLEIAQVLVEDTKDLPQSKFDSLVKIIRRDDEHKKETTTKAWRIILKDIEQWFFYSVIFCFIFCVMALFWWLGGIVGLLFLAVWVVIEVSLGVSRTR